MLNCLTIETGKRTKKMTTSTVFLLSFTRQIWMKINLQKCNIMDEYTTYEFINSTMVSYIDSNDINIYALHILLQIYTHYKSLYLNMLISFVLFFVCFFNKKKGTKAQPNENPKTGIPIFGHPRSCIPLHHLQYFLDQ